MPKLHAKTRVRPHKSRRTLASDMEFLKFWRFLMYPSLEDIVIYLQLFFCNIFISVKLPPVLNFYCKIYHFSVIFANDTPCCVKNFWIVGDTFPDSLK